MPAIVKTPRPTSSARISSRSLRDYRVKRDFSVSPEPSGDQAPGKSTTRGKSKKSFYFCVQKHLASHLHYDFRLEHHGVLLSWAVPKGPSLNPKDKRLAMKVEDHPYDYGDFEGVIPAGYGAGVVMLWDSGKWTTEQDDVDAALKKGELKFSLAGTKLKGSWILIRTGRGDGGESRFGSRSWLLIKHTDQWAGAVDVVQLASLSVKSGGDFADILANESADIWKSDRPAKGGVAGELLADVITRAAEIKAKRRGPSQRGNKSPKRVLRRRGVKS